MLSAQDELNKYWERKGSLFADALLNCVSARFESSERAQAMDDLAGLIQKTLVLSNLYGRKRVLVEASLFNQKGKAAKFSEIPHEANPLGGPVFTEAVENVLARFEKKEIIIPQYQRDADQWDDSKKSLFIESILNRLTVPAFCGRTFVCSAARATSESQQAPVPDSGGPIRPTAVRRPAFQTCLSATEKHNHGPGPHNPFCKRAGTFIEEAVNNFHLRGEALRVNGQIRIAAVVIDREIASHACSLR